jgi:hypothetical protein
MSGHNMFDKENEHVERIRRRLEGYEVAHTYAQLRKAYDSNPALQEESFEDFVERCHAVKKIIDEMKLQFKVRR